MSEEQQQSLPLKYRPQTLEDVAGNTAAVEAVRTFIKRKDRPRSFLFAGPSGCGKTTLVRIMAKELGCHHNDFFEYNASNTRGIDTVREISSNCRLSPLRKGSTKVYLLDEAHQLTKDASNALLKILEDGPSHAYFMLATTNPERLLRAIQTRCSVISVAPLTSKDMTKLIKKICSAEEVEFPSEVIQAVVTAADGSPREGLKLLDTIIDIEDDETALSMVQSFVASEANVKEICQILMQNGNKAKRWKQLAPMLKAIQSEAESLRRGILGYLGAVLLNKGDMKLADKMEFFKDNLYDSGKAGLIQACFYAVFLEE